MTDTATETGYAPVNGLRMYYEIHGAGREGVPLVLLHGAFSAIGTSFGELLPGLAATRRVIGVELQAHGRTADVDRPLRIEFLAEDTAALLRHLEIEQADVFGYSTGGAVALQLVLRHPALVRKLVLASVATTRDGVHPGLFEGLGEMKPEMMHGSPWHEEYVRLAPDPAHFPVLFAKKAEMDRETRDVPAEAVRAIAAPTLLIIGDSDIIRPEHSVELFRLLGGGVMGDLAGLPAARLAVLPGTTHATLVDRADWLVSMVTDFLDAPAPAPAAAPASPAGT
jgi:pimeloyl-ACP methyl ester carboxylesterase